MSGFRLLLILLLSILTGCQDTGVVAKDVPCENGMLYPADPPFSYYYCINGEPQYEPCPVGTYFDATFLMCRHGQQTNTDTSLDKSGVCQRGGMTGDLTDCSRYYHCDRKGADLKRGDCPPNQIFDLTKFSCVPGKC
ncbi:GH16472 [Drosophila grimshawi]|uniref:GH16472 n=1 Tax=Drosophila grimshawi TaxID=7222 RepID=B4J0H2_DROGR|nr:GH16472 [Drosophila grimshawi]